MLVVFDLDGTLIDMNERWYQLHLDATQAQGLPNLDKKTYIAAKRAGQAETAILQQISTDIANIEAYNQQRIAWIEDRQYLDYNQPFEGALEAIEAWSKVGPMYLMSKRKSNENFHWEVDKKGLSGLFEQCIPTGGREKLPVLQEHFSPAELKGAIMISDAFADYQTALTLGMQPVVVSYGCRNKEYLLAKGVPAVVEDCWALGELAWEFV